MNEQKPKYKYLNYLDIELDTNNPHLSNSYRNLSEEKIIEYMLLNASTLELMMAIGENNFFDGEQLLVIQNPETKKYKVIEGNRRLTAVKLLNHPELATVEKVKVSRIISEAKYIPKEIPCLIFSNEKEINKYLGFRHITGIEPWNLRQKAKYLYGLKKENFSNLSFKDSCRELAKTIGSRTEYVKRIIVGYEIYKIIEDKKFFNIKDLDEERFYFGYIADSLSRSNICAFLGIDFEDEEPTKNLSIENLKYWTHWLFERYSEGGRTRLKGKSDDLNKLNIVLGSETAKKEFIEKDIELNKAYELTEDINTIFDENIQRSLQYIETANSIAHKVTDFKGIEDLLVQIRKLTSKIKDAKEEFERENEEDKDDFR